MTRFWIGVSLFALAGCSAGEADKAPEPVALVQMATATDGEISDSIALHGAVEPGPGSERTLSAATEAVVAAIVAPPGSAVGAGALVVQLAPSPQSALDRTKARSDAVAADNALARAQRLKADGLVGNAEVDAARATAQAADATWASLNHRAGALTLSAPIAGVVDAMLVKPGDLVATGTSVARIATGGATRARFGIDPALARTVTPGSRITVSSATGSGGSTVPVSGVDRVVDPATRLAAVFANLPAGAGLSLGEPLSGALLRPHGTHGTVIPYAAVQDDGGVPFVYVVTSNTAHRREVKLGPQAGDSVIILSGVKPGERVVTQGGTALEDGMKVRIGPLKDEAADDKAAAGKDDK